MSQPCCEWYFPSNLLPKPISTFIHRFLHKRHYVTRAARAAWDIFHATFYPLIPQLHPRTPLKCQMTTSMPVFPPAHLFDGCKHRLCIQVGECHGSQYFVSAPPPVNSKPPALSMCSHSTEIRPPTSFQTSCEVGVPLWSLVSPRKPSVFLLFLLLQGQGSQVRFSEVL